MNFHFIQSSYNHYWKHYIQMRKLHHHGKHCIQIRKLCSDQKIAFQSHYFQQKQTIFLQVRKKRANKQTTSSSNAQMNHIRHTYKTLLKSSPLHNQPLWIFRLLQSSSNCTTEWFPITLWSWVKIKTNQTGIKLKSLVMSNIILSFQHIGSQASWRRPMLKVYSIKRCSLPWILLVENIHISFNKPTGCGNILNFIQIQTDWNICKKMAAKFLIFHTTLTLNKGQGLSTGIKMQSSEVSTIRPSLKQMSLQNVQSQAECNFSFSFFNFFTKSHK